MSANETQIGGDHYKTGGEEHWDRMWRLYGRGYFVGCITKYVERYHKKNGFEDLKKARHFLDKLIELENYRERTDKEDSSQNQEKASDPAVFASEIERIRNIKESLVCRICRHFPPRHHPHCPEADRNTCGGYVNQD